MNTEPTIPPERQSFWTTLPGILAQVAAVIVAITGFIALFIHQGHNVGHGLPTPTPAPDGPPLPTATATPQIINSSGRLHRIASNDHCEGDERSWVYVTNSIKIGLLGVSISENNRVDIRVKQTHDGKTTEFHDIHPHKDWTVPIGAGNLQIYIEPVLDDCWVDYEVF